MLKLYSQPDSKFLFKDSHIFTVTFDGRLGGTFERKIFLRNDNTTKWYESITIQPIDTSGINIVDGTDGFSWKLIEKDTNPTLEEWNLVSPGDLLTLSSNLGSAENSDTITFLPIWVQVTIPENQPIQNITDVVLRISATENLI